MFFNKDVISLTVKFDNKDFSLRYIDMLNRNISGAVSVYIRYFNPDP